MSQAPKPTLESTHRDHTTMSISKTFIGGAVCRDFESEAPVAEGMLDRVVCSREQFSFQTCYESDDGIGTFVTGDRVPDSWCHDA